jgi:amino acid permease
MRLTMRSPKDFWIGVIYLVIGLAALAASWGYDLGVTGKMGPGYFPTALSLLLMAFGAISLVRSLVLHGEPIARVDIKAVLLVTSAVVAFGFLLERAGLIIALAALFALGSAASRQNRLNATSVLVAAGLIAFCILVFVQGLKVPMTLFGDLAD